MRGQVSITVQVIFPCPQMSEWGDNELHFLRECTDFWKVEHQPILPVCVDDFINIHEKCKFPSPLNQNSNRLELGLNTYMLVAQESHNLEVLRANYPGKFIAMRRSMIPVVKDIYLCRKYRSSHCKSSHHLTAPIYQTVVCTQQQAKTIHLPTHL